MIQDLFYLAMVFLLKVKSDTMTVTSKLKNIHYVFLSYIMHIMDCKTPTNAHLNTNMNKDAKTRRDFKIANFCVRSLIVNKTSWVCRATLEFDYRLG